MLPAILGGLAAGAGGSLVGGLLGGGGPTYEPSETMQDLSAYGRNQLRASKKQKKAIKAEARTYESPGAKEAFLQSYLDRFSNPEFIQKQLTRSYKQPIDYRSGGYRDLASFAYGQQGLSMPEKDFERYIDIAKATNVRSPEAFSDFIRQDMIASNLVKTPADLDFELRRGPMRRDAEGRLERGLFRVNPANVATIASSMLGA